MGMCRLLMAGGCLLCRVPIRFSYENTCRQACISRRFTYVGIDVEDACGLHLLHARILRVIGLHHAVPYRWLIVNLVDEILSLMRVYETTKSIQ
jgi:hypothetical protein